MSRPRRPRHSVAVAVLAGLAVLLAACGQDNPVIESPSPIEPTVPTTPPAVDPTTVPPPTEPTAAPTTPDGGPQETETVIDEGTDAGIVLTATLTGPAEVPGPGDPTGSGTFRGTMVLAEAGAELCYRIEVTNLSSGPTAAHIHTGAEGEEGPVFVPLLPPVGDSVEECTPLNASEALPLLDDPSGFYVNVHTEAHPAGAVRGQLSD